MKKVPDTQALLVEFWKMLGIPTDRHDPTARNTKKHGVRRKEFAEIIGVTPDQVYRWHAEHRLPLGQALIKILYLGLVVGITVEGQDVSKLPDQSRMIGFGILLDLIDFKKWKEELKFSEAGWVYGKAFGQSVVPSEPARRQTFDALVEALVAPVKEKIAAMKRKLSEIPGATFGFEDVQSEVKTPQPSDTLVARQVTPQGGSITKKEIERLVLHLEEALPIVARLLADESPQAMRFREEIRRLIPDDQNHGPTTVFALSTLLNRLCSERIRNTEKPLHTRG